jgi:hypothetical protein
MGTLCKKSRNCLRELLCLIVLYTALPQMAPRRSQRSEFRPDFLSNRVPDSTKPTVKWVLANKEKD